MKYFCDWRMVNDDERLGSSEEPCGKPAVAHITWPGNHTFYYCAEHYDKRIIFLRKCDRLDVLMSSGAL